MAGFPPPGPVPRHRRGGHAAPSPAHHDPDGHQPARWVYGRCARRHHGWHQRRRPGLQPGGKQRHDRRALRHAQHARLSGLPVPHRRGPDGVVAGGQGLADSHHIAHGDHLRLGLPGCRRGSDRLRQQQRVLSRRRDQRQHGLADGGQRRCKHEHRRHHLHRRAAGRRGEAGGCTRGGAQRPHLRRALHPDGGQHRGRAHAQRADQRQPAQRLCGRHAHAGHQRRTERDGGQLHPQRRL